MRYRRFAFVAVLGLVSVPAAWAQPQAELVLHFVEIGQGDCTLIECPNGGFILVDAGSNAHGDRDAVRDYVRDQLDQANPRIDTVVVTHPHTDHYNFLPDVLADDIEVGQVLLVEGNDTYQQAGGFRPPTTDETEQTKPKLIENRIPFSSRQCPFLFSGPH